MDAELCPLNQGQLEHSLGSLNYFMHSLSWTIFVHLSLYPDFPILLFFSSFVQIPPIPPSIVTHLISFIEPFLIVVVL